MAVNFWYFTGKMPGLSEASPKSLTPPLLPFGRGLASRHHPEKRAPISQNSLDRSVGPRYPYAFSIGAPRGNVSSRVDLGHASLWRARGGPGSPSRSITAITTIKEAGRDTISFCYLHAFVIEPPNLLESLMKSRRGTDYMTSKCAQKMYDSNMNQKTKRHIPLISL